MNQLGYALLLSLFLMLGVSGVWFAGTGVYESSHNRNHRNQTLELERARQALISYAVNYVDHYGAQSAGIGHLPCPDTDSPVESQDNSWALDGPNPPCGAQAVELGWLPRHVNTSSGRYLFHTRIRQRLHYAVSGRFVNNPLNRTVNPATVGDISVGNFNDIVAVLTVPTLGATDATAQAWWEGDDIEANHVAYAIIRTNDIRVAAMRRVANWLLARLNAQATKPLCELGHELELLRWLSSAAASSDCATYKDKLLAEFAIFEGVPYARHWFFRNKWFEHIKIEINCFAINRNSCEFAVAPNAISDIAITFILQETENPS